jgi:uncharacterized protein YegL
MTMLEEMDIEFAENPEPRCACMLLLDTSGSMQGEKIAALNEGIRTFKEEVQSDPLASRRVEVAIVTFDSRVEVVQDFVTVDQFDPPLLDANGQTAMGTGILRALELVRERKEVYKRYGIAYYRPWIFMITDGEPTEPDHIVQRAAQQVRREEQSKGVTFYAVGVDSANMAKLAEISVQQPFKLRGLAFRELFEWLSASMQRVSSSSPGEQAPLAPIGWSEP